MDTQPELKNSKEIIVYLSNRFPNCFSVEGEAKPLKVGIFQDLAERLADEEQFSKTKLRAVLRSYTASWRYLYCIKEGVHRVDLDGNIGEVITAEQAEHAQAQLKESKEKAKANRKVIENNKEKPARRPSSKPKMKQNTTRQNSLPKSSEKMTNTVSKPVQQKVDLAQLKVNDTVKIVLGSKPVPATISSIEKGNIKVKISSGMELTVTVDRILL